MTGWRICAAGPEFSAPLAALHEICFAPLPETPWSAAAFRALLRVPGTRAWIACSDDNAPVGLLAVRDSGGETEILTLCVHPDVRRQGLGSALFSKLFDETPGSTRTVLEVASDNAGAIGLYRSLGFAEVGRRPDYYPGARGRTDALILARPGVT